MDIKTKEKLLIEQLKKISAKLDYETSEELETLISNFEELRLDKIKNVFEHLVKINLHQDYFKKMDYLEFVKFWEDDTEMEKNCFEQYVTYEDILKTFSNHKTN